MSGTGSRRGRRGSRGGDRGPDCGLDRADMDATLITAYSRKEKAAPPISPFRPPPARGLVREPGESMAMELRPERGLEHGIGPPLRPVLRARAGPGRTAECHRPPDGAWHQPRHHAHDDPRDPGDAPSSGWTIASRRGRYRTSRRRRGNPASRRRVRRGRQRRVAEITGLMSCRTGLAGCAGSSAGSGRPAAT
jgi:hypothetical protein